jgi:cysteine desulfurase
VLEVCRDLAGRGFDLTVVPVDGTGRVDAARVAAAFRPDTILVSVMHANNEVGTLQPVKEIAVLARQKGILVHTDAAQSLGKIPVNVDDLGVDLLSVAGHKIYAPKGIGALYIRADTPIVRFCHGA